MRNLFAIGMLFTSFLTFSQETNLQSYTPSILFDKGDWEFKSFQNLYTQTKSFDADGDRVKNASGRQTWFTSINQFLYGLNSKVNIGADVWVKNVNYKLSNESRTDIVGFGPKIKIAPFNKLKRLSIQSTLLFPLANDLEDRKNDGVPFLETDATIWLNQLFLDVPLNDKSQLFFQQAFWYRFVRESFAENNFLQSQTSTFYSYFATDRLTLYGMTEYFPTHYNSSFGVQKGEAFYSYFIQSGIGTKYQLIPNLIELEFLYTNFWAGSEGQGAGETFNLGIRVIRQ
ncbi:MAG: hypothetical protein RIM99_05380 [Cyclobacteriaceae bacterium]